MHLEGSILTFVYPVPIGYSVAFQIESLQRFVINTDNNATKLKQEKSVFDC